MHFVTQVFFQRPQPAPDAWRSVPLGVQQYFQPAYYQLRSSFRTQTHLRWPPTGQAADRLTSALFVPPTVIPIAPALAQHRLASYRSLASIRWFNPDLSESQYTAALSLGAPTIPDPPPMDGLLRSSFRPGSSIRWFVPNQTKFFQQPIWVLYQPAEEALRQSFLSRTNRGWFDPMLPPAFHREVFVLHQEYQPAYEQERHGLPNPTNLRWYSGGSTPFYIVAVEGSLDSGTWFPHYPAVILTRYDAVASGEQT